MRMPGVRLVAAVHVHDHRRQPLERARARERARVERAAGDELAGQLRARAPSRRRRRRRRTRPRRAVPAARFAAAIEWSPAATGAATTSWMRSASERASGSGRTPSFAKRRSLATESSGVCAECRATALARRSAASAFDREHDEVGAANGVVVRRARCTPPSSAAAARARSASREPITTSSSPIATSRPASARPNGPVPPTIAILTPAAPAASSTAAGEAAARVVVAHQRPRDDGAHPAGQLGRRVGLVDDERVDQTRVAARDVRGRRCRRRAARACGRPGP